jgi:arylsulfatase
MDTHIPYSPKHEALKSIEYSKAKALYLIYKHWGIQIQLTKSELEQFKRLYDLQIRHIDDTLEEYLPKLTQNDFENTLTIITADHGEEFMEHGKIGHSTPLSETLLHVPLIISGGGLERKTINMKSSLLDLAPTILDILGLKEYNRFRGKSLLNIREGRPVIAQGIFQGKKHERIF